jgi:hypothetical protein
MKLVDIISQAQMISGIGVFEGNAIDQNLMATSLAIFHQTLNSINNDPKITLIQETWNYNVDNDQEPEINIKISLPGSWIDIPQLGDDSQTEELIDTESKFPDYSLPFPISKSYPIPNDCRRVIKAFSGNVELRKTDFSEIIKARQVPSYLNMFAINNKKIELIYPGKLVITYAKEFKQFMPQDQVDLPIESIDYVINLLAYNLALTFQRDSVERCKILAEKSYNALAGTLTVNMGDLYQNIYTAMNRFSGRGGAWL